MALELQGPATGDHRAQRRLAVMQQLTAALARARSYTAIASVIIGEAMPAIGAEVGVVALVSEDGRTLRNVGFEGVDADTRSQWQSYPVESPVPVAEAARTGLPIIVRTLAERNARYPVLAQVHGLEHGGPVVAFPLHIDGRLLAVLAFCWGGPVDLDADDLSFLATLAEQCGLAIERARLYELAQRELGERKASEQKLREVNARKDEFLAMLAHELRNPLAPILSVADMLATMNLEPRLTRLHQVLARQVGHMKRIVDDLLDVSRLTRDRLTLAPEVVDLAALVRSTASDHAPAFAAAGLALVVDAPATPIRARADVTRLSQALANLLHNALKFTPRGKVVHVGVGRDDAGAVIEVSDQGPGLDAELLPRLFEPFAQADRSLARAGGGLGLGLALVDGIVRLHGGEVVATSDVPGGGARFRVHLPVLADEAPVVGAPATAFGPDARQVLIVDDNQDAAEMLGAVVSALGHDVRIAHAAHEALAVLEHWCPHVILSDLGLPGVDGYALARQVRALREPPPMLVAISGYGSAADKERAREAGFAQHLTKPADAATIARLIAASARD